MKRKWYRHKVIFLAAGLVVFMTTALGAGIIWSNKMIEKETVKAAEKEVEGSEIISVGSAAGYEKEITYKEHVQKTDVGEEIGKKVSEKFGFDWETVTYGAISREIFNYEEALCIQRDLADCPLYAEYAKKVPANEGYDEWEYWSLELYINEIYAFAEGKEVIESYCREHKINPDTSLVSDLSVEDIIGIGELAYETSDHPKN